MLEAFTFGVITGSWLVICIEMIRREELDITTKRDPRKTLAQTLEQHINEYR